MNVERSPVSIPWLIVAGVCAPFGFNVVATLLPAIQAEFALDHSRMQWMVSTYALTMALGQLIGGPLSDAFGRRRILLFGLALFSLASLGAALASSYPQLLAMRVVQGLGACVTLVIPRAVVRDRFAGPDAARAMALIMISFTLTPALAPLVGGLMQSWRGWPAGFVACAVVGLVLFLCALRLHGETLSTAQRVRFSVAGTFAGYAGMFASRRFCAYALSYSLLNCCFMGFLVIGPSSLTRDYGLSSIGVALAMLAAYLGFGAGNLLAARHVKRIGVDRILAWGVAGGLFGTLMLFAASFSQVLGWLLAAVFVQSAGTGLAFPAGIAGATAVFPQRAGTASALVGAVQLIIAALFAILAGALDDRSFLPLAWACLVVCSGSALCVWPLWRRRGQVALRAARR